MHRVLFLFLILTISGCSAQKNTEFSLEFSSNLAHFEPLSGLKERLEGVEIIALGENTHGLGDLFDKKAELVRFLHQEMGFDLLLFESGYGDAALAWENRDSLSLDEYTRAFSSNRYYHSEEIKNLMRYVKAQRDHPLIVQGIDCQPQQDYLIKRMEELLRKAESELSVYLGADSIQMEMQRFNLLYQFEHDKDTAAFHRQVQRFSKCLLRVRADLVTSDFLGEEMDAQKSEIAAISQMIQIFWETYGDIPLGGMMSWPMAYEIRDRSMFETVQWFREQYPDKKIIIWAQNSHIEKASKPNYDITWMGHLLADTYGEKYYSIGAVVYSGESLSNNGTLEFEHTSPDYLAYHLHRFEKEAFVLDLHGKQDQDFLKQEFLGMESNGNTATFIAKDRFDGLLFLRHSDIPTLLQDE